MTFDNLTGTTDTQTLYYFFSTLAQSYAAITALFFAAGLARITWLDTDITSKKKAILYSYLNTPYFTLEWLESQMCRLSASEVAIMGINNNISKSREIANILNNRIVQIQELRSSLNYLTILGLYMTGLGIIGVLFTNIIHKDPNLKRAVIIIALFSILLSLVTIIIFIKRCLDVSTVSKRLTKFDKFLIRTQFAIGNAIKSLKKRFKKE